MTYQDDLHAFRQNKDEHYRTHKNSPLTPAQQAAFTGLRYYPAAPALNLTVTVEPFAEQQTIEMPTSAGKIKTFARYGRFTFEVEGQAVQLTLYKADYGFFLPFVDANAGKETYGAGRYLDPQSLDNDLFHVDFNLAYNPYCVYGDGWNCPIPPAENRLNVAIRAGEMLPEGAWVALGFTGS